MKLMPFNIVAATLFSTSVAFAQTAQEKHAQELAAIDNRLNELAVEQHQRNRAVKLGVTTACRNLWTQSQDAAFLNPVCVETFLRDGLPEG
jgi:hypothetical protein